MFSQENSTKSLEKSKHWSCSNSSRKLRGRKTQELILQSYHPSDTKSRQRCSQKKKKKKKRKKRKLQAIITNITDVPRCKSPQQNFSKQNPTTHLKSYTMTKWAFIAGMQDSSILANQSMWYTILTNWKIKTIWLFQ